LETEVKPLVEAFLHERGLTLSPEKTVVTHISDGVDFLGQHLRKYHGTLRITPSAKNVKALLEKVRTTIAKSGQASAGDLIERLNPMIRGWAFFHRHVSSARTFSRVHHAIFHALWAWARRRHPKKGTGWVRKRYFHTVGNRHWVFSGPVPDEDGTPVAARLFATTSCRFQRHTKVKANANPYDPAWWAYFTQRRARRTQAKPAADGSPVQELHASPCSPQAAPLLRKGGVRRD
jgi:RNA-directed DNA polymerase